MMLIEEILINDEYWMIVKSTLGIEKEGGQEKYLGLPESFGRRKKDVFTLIVDRIRQRSIKYSSRFLSSAGKLTMLKSVLSAIPTYAIAKEQGGLGFREIQSFNDSLLAKISWRIFQNPSCLLSKILIGKYCKFQDFLHVPIKTSTSHGWRGILIGRDLLVHQLGRAIGDGQTTSLWNDPWLSLSTPLRPTGPPRSSDKDLLVSDILLDHSREWNREKISEILPFHLEEIQALRPSRNGASDSFIWLPTKSREYSVKSGYHLAMELKETQNLQQPQPKVNWNADIWQIKASPKMKVFLWKIVQEALPLGENLLNRGIMENPCCVHCGDLETTEHLFFHCSFAQEVWKLAPFSISIDPLLIQSFTSTLPIAKTWICLPPTGVGSGTLFPWIVWALWKTRNQLIFEERTFTPAETMIKATVEAKEWQLAQLGINVIKKIYIPNSRTRDPPNTIDCFTDGSWTEEHRIGGLGWIFTRATGERLDQGQEAERFVSSPLMAEALAIRSALNHALEIGIACIHLKSDAQVLIRAISSQEQISEIYGILFDINALASMFTSISFSFISRSENSLADSLAKDAKSRLVALISQRDPLVFVAGNV
ncbi:unnamed protein product [Microthlaspi erraticum]|uniref:Uncharacterized protein n=1 Tax=Microthlaspi erraticum TaxID=1685480 RepID=A0A6D2J8K9_9BRAS|nr:unnamed protein product [Microthlaspi erraticum]